MRVFFSDACNLDQLRATLDGLAATARENLVQLTELFAACIAGDVAASSRRHRSVDPATSVNRNVTVTEGQPSLDTRPRNWQPGSTPAAGDPLHCDAHAGRPVVPGRPPAAARPECPRTPDRRRTPTGVEAHAQHSDTRQWRLVASRQPSGWGSHLGHRRVRLTNLYGDDSRPLCSSRFETAKSCVVRPAFGEPSSIGIHGALR